MNKKFYLSIAFLVSALAINGCKDPITSSPEESSTPVDSSLASDSSLEQIVVEGIAISSENDVRTIEVGQTLQLSAKVYPLAALQDVTWSSNDSSIATVDENGLVSAVSAGNVVIVATSVADTSITQSCSLIIQPSEPEVILPESITINSENNINSIRVGETTELTAVIYPVEASQSILWQTSDSTIATVEHGVVTGLKVGSVTISAIAKEDNTISTSYTLTILEGEDVNANLDWVDMSFNTHDEFINAEKGDKLKVKGVVTHVFPVEDNTVCYYLQNGNQGFYVYEQNATTYPVELGKVYEVGGYKKYYYTGTHEIADVEYFVESSENITYTVTSLEGFDPTSTEQMTPYFYSLVSGKATITSIPEIGTKAYSVDVTINDVSTEFRIDPSTMTSDEFSAINDIFNNAVEGCNLDFKGIMIQFGYGKKSNQIQIVNSSDLKLAEITEENVVNAVVNVLHINESVLLDQNNITLPTTSNDFENVKISWSSNNAAIDVNTGNVTHGTDDTLVTLTATVSYGNESVTKQFNVNVFGTLSLQEVATMDLEDALPSGTYGTSASKPSYNEANATLGGNTWMFRNSLIANSSSDRFDGTMSIRIQGNSVEAETGRVEILSEGEYNYVEFAAALYGGDSAGLQIGVQYTTDNGATWIDSGVFVTLVSTELNTYRIVLPEGNKRIAFYVVPGSGKRANLDNIRLLK